MATVKSPARRAFWSASLTQRIARNAPPAARPAMLAAIKAIHTMIFFGVAAQIAAIVWDGVRQRPGRRTALAFAIAVGESAVYVSNNQVCPLTPLAEELGAEKGSVADIFLPDAVSARIPLVGGGALVAGIILNAWAWLHRSQA
jgi:hypothetical protein